MKPLIRSVKEGTTTPEDISYLINFTQENGGIDYAESVMNKIANQARQLLDKYPESPVKVALNEYVDYVIERKK